MVDLWRKTVGSLVTACKVALFLKKVANTIAVQEQTLYHLPTAVGSFSEASNTEVSFLLLPTKVFPFLRES